MGPSEKTPYIHNVDIIKAIKLKAILKSYNVINMLKM